MADLTVRRFAEYSPREGIVFQFSWLITLSRSDFIVARQSFFCNTAKKGFTNLTLCSKKLPKVTADSLGSSLQLKNGGATVAI